MLRKKEKGFTLIELLVVIAILGILAAVVVPRVLGAMENSRRGSNIANQAIIQSAVARFNVDTARWPTGPAPGGGAIAPTIAPLTAALLADYLQGGTLPTIRNVDMDPGTGAILVDSDDVWGINTVGTVVILDDAPTPPVVLWPVP